MNRYINNHHIVETSRLESSLSDPKIRILDCSVDFTTDESGVMSFTPARAAWESGHIPGADFVDFFDELSSEDTDLPLMLPGGDVFAEVMSKHGIDNDCRVVLYDGFYNMWAARLWWMFRAYGFTRAAVLNGGIEKWKIEGRPLSKENPGHTPTKFVSRPEPGFFCGKEEIAAALEDENTCLIDALSQEQYSGKSPAGGLRPGHITSALNISWTAIVDPKSHTFLPKERLEALFRKRGIDEDDRVIAYCMAGIVASGLAFALSLLGRENLSIYDGSLFEWSADPTLPMSI